METNLTQIKHVVASTPALMTLLRAVRDVGPPDAYIAAGAIRNTVWDSITGRPLAESWTDVDVVYFDASEPADRSRHYQHALKRHLPTIPWEVTNQACVHLWHAGREDRALAPHRSLLEGLATWPETATAVGVRLDASGGLDVIAPFGLADLFNLVVRPNPRCRNPAAYLERLTAKQWTRRWPELTILQADQIGGPDRRGC